MGHALNVAHHGLGIGKHVAVDPLQDITPRRSRPRAHRQAECIVDVSRAVGLAGHFPAGNIEEMRDVKGSFYQLFHDAFPFAPFHATLPRATDCGGSVPGWDTYERLDS